MTNVEILDELNRIISRTIILEHAIIGIREGSDEKTVDALAIHAADVVNGLEKLKQSIAHE